jgi:hypothetical protein
VQLKIQGFSFSFKNLMVSFLAAIVLCNIGTITTGHMAFADKYYSHQVDSLLTWNKLVTKILAEEELPPPSVSRIYALTHIAIYDSILIAKNENIDSKYLNIVLSYAAYTVLKDLFPEHLEKITLLKDNIFSYIENRDISIGDLEASKQIGIQVGKEVIDYSKNDNSNAQWDNQIPIGDCIWNGENPVLPMAGYWKTYILESGSEIQPLPPFRCNSPQDLRELDIVFQAAMNLTPEQIEAVHKWGDTSPPVIWNEIMTNYIETYNLDLFDAAHLAAYLHVGMYDAFVSTWYTKYDYWTARPDQRIEDFETLIPTPNFPAYTSGHSVISNVAAKILGEIFYKDRNHLEKLADEASLSRLWAGIHFKQDIVQGKEQGLKIGEKIIDDMNMPIHAFIAYMKENNNLYSYY